MTQLSSSYTYNGMQLIPTQLEPINTPKGLLVTRAVEVKDGWVGQIIIDKTIVWESDCYEDDESAITATNLRVVEKLSKLFA